MKRKYYGVSMLMILNVLVTAKARLVAHEPLAKTIFDLYGPLQNEKSVPYNSLENAPFAPLASSIVDLYDPLANAKLDSYDPLASTMIDSHNPLATPRLPLKKASLVSDDDPLKVFRSWTVNRESGHCTIVASTKPYTSVDPSLFLSIHGAIEDINGNITSIRLRELQREDQGLLDAEGLARSSSWRYDACKCACHEARRETCQIYNCKRIKEKFDHNCKRNCKDEFC